VKIISPIIVRDNILTISVENLQNFDAIDVLENKRSVREIQIFSSHIEDYSSLIDFINLRSLKIFSSNLEAIPNLENLVNLEAINLSKNELNRIEGLDHLINLKILLLSYNNIENISGLNNLVNLEELSLSYNKIKNIDNLNDCRNLKFLSFIGNKINEIKGLDELEKLEQLLLGNNHIKKIQGLDSLIELWELYLNDNQIKIIENLFNLKKLNYLELDGNKITLIKNLKQLTNLEWLRLNNNQIEKIENVNANVKLTHLYLDNNKIKEIDGLDNLLNLRFLSLNNNPIEELKGIEHLSRLRDIELNQTNLKSLDLYMAQNAGNAQKLVEYCLQKKRGDISYLGFYNQEKNPDENIQDFRKTLQNVDDISEFINIGTYREYGKFKLMQNSIFLNDTPQILSFTNNTIQKKKLIFHLIQLHSLKGVRGNNDYNKVRDFNFFIGHFWDKEEIKNNVLVYNDFEIRCINKIKELLLLSLHDYRGKPDIIIFPENSIPYETLEYLKKFSSRNDIIIVGGLEHQKIRDKKYINKAFIIQEGDIKYQIKQTAVRIYDEIGDYIQEGIKCEIFPNINIFETKYGRVAIFICKDFLRLSEIVPYWAKKNTVEFIIIPSLSGKVLPFNYRLINMYEFISYEDLKIIFTNIGEFGGSELYSIRDKTRIELQYQNNFRYNLGEKIVIRDCDQTLLSSGSYLLKEGMYGRLNDSIDESELTEINFED
jgi:Leucine-rich repeat (LRR) protein